MKICDQHRQENHSSVRQIDERKKERDTHTLINTK